MRGLFSNVKRRLLNSTFAAILAVGSLTGIVAPILAPVAGATNGFCTSGTVVTVNENSGWPSYNDNFTWSNPTGGSNGSSTTWTGAQTVSTVTVTTTGTGGSASHQVNSYVTKTVDQFQHGGNTYWAYYNGSSWVSLGVNDGNPTGLTYSYQLDGEYTVNHYTTNGWTASAQVYTGTQWVSNTPTQPSSSASDWIASAATGYQITAAQVNYNGNSWQTAPNPSDITNPKNGGQPQNINGVQYCVSMSDTTAPTINYTRTPSNGNDWNDGSVVVTFTCADNAGGSGLSTASAAAFPDVVTLSTDGAGQSTTSPSCSDVAGNIANPVTVSDINIDTVKPVITASENPMGATAGSVTVTFTCSDALSGVDASATILITSQVVSSDGWVNSDGNCVDNAGNVADSTSFDVTNIDTTPSSAPWIVSPFYGSYLDHHNVHIDWTSPHTNHPPLTYQIEIATDPGFHHIVVNESGSNHSNKDVWLNDGRYWVRVNDTNDLGVTSAWSFSDHFTVDTHRPSVSITAPANHSLTNDNTVTLKGHSWDFNPDKYSWKVVSDTTHQVVYFTEHHSPFVATVTTPALADGGYTISLTAVDKAGNWATKTIHITIDTTIAVDATGYTGTNTEPTITGTTDEATNTVTVDGAPVTVDPDGTWSYTFGSPIVVGNHTVTVEATDAAGNSATKDVAVDITAPVTPPTPPATPTTPTPNTNGGNGGQGGDTSDNTPADNTDVLGVSTDNNGNTNKGSTDVKGASTQKNTNDAGDILGLAWYWWLLILLILAGLIWWLIGAWRRREDEEDGKK